MAEKRRPGLNMSAAERAAALEEMRAGNSWTPEATLSFIGSVLKAPVDAAGDIMKNYRPGAENEPLNEDIGRQGFTAGPAAMLPAGAGRVMAGGTGLGASAGRILQRTDAQKLIKDMASSGKSADEIAVSLNERFASLLDEGEKISRPQVYYNTRKAGIEMGSPRPRSGGGETELAAMGGGGRQSPGRITTEDVTQWLERSDVPYRVKPHEGGSTYVQFDPPHGPPKPGDKVPVVRVPPEDLHYGPQRGKSNEAGNRFDTGSEWPYNGPKKLDKRITHNTGGEPYADPEALEAALKWRTSSAPPGENWLVRPDQAPRIPKSRSTIEAPQPAPAAEGPIQDPRQLKLLAGGDPLLSRLFGMSRPSSEIEPAKSEDRPESSPDDRLIYDTQRLTSRVKDAADDVPMGRLDFGQAMRTPRDPASGAETPTLDTSVLLQLIRRIQAEKGNGG